MNVSKRNISMKSITVILLISVLMLGCILYGMSIHQENSYAASGALNTATGQWVGTGLDNGATCTVGYTNTYYIDMCGGPAGTSAKGGKLTVVTNLKKGDVISINVIKNDITSLYVGNQMGGDGIILSINGEYAVGAGGAGGGYYQSYSTYKEALADAYGGGSTVALIDNTKFSAGGCAGYSTASYRYMCNNTSPGKAGATLAGFTAAAAGTYCTNGVAGTNYLNPDLCDLVEQTNDSSVVEFKVYTKKATEENNPESFAGMASAMNRMASAMESGATGGSSENSSVASVLNVVAGEAFSLYVPMEIDTVGTFTSDGISCINNVANDGYVKIVGVKGESGQQEYLFSSTVIVINAIDEPNSTNISAVFN